MPLGVTGTLPTRTPYPQLDGALVRQVKDANGMPQTQIRLYNGTGGVLTAARLYVVGYGGTTTTAPNPRVAAPATSTVQKYYVVSLAASADAAYDWFVLAGYCSLGLEGTTDIAAGDFIKAVNAQVYAVKDATSLSAVSVGLALEAQAADSVVNKIAYMTGERVTL